MSKLSILQILKATELSQWIEKHQYAEPITWKITDIYKKANTNLKESSSKSMGIEHLLKSRYLSTQYCIVKTTISKGEAKGTKRL